MTPRTILSTALFILLLSLLGNPPAQAAGDGICTPSYGETFFNPALGVEQSIRVLLPPAPSSTTGEPLATVYFLHGSPRPDATADDMVNELDKAVATLQPLLVGLGSTRAQLEALADCPSWRSDRSCAVSYLATLPHPSLSGSITALGAELLLGWMGIPADASLPFIEPMILVLADYRNGFYTDRNAGSESFYPATDRGDRAGRLRCGAVGDYESAVLAVVEHVESHYPAARERQRRLLWGQSMGAYGAVKIAHRHSDTFGGVAAQSGTMYSGVIALLYQFGGSMPLNMSSPGIFDIFGYGTFDRGGNGSFPLPLAAAEALDGPFMLEQDPLATLQASAPVPIYLEAGWDERSNRPDIYWTSKFFCEAMRAEGRSGEAVVNFPGQHDGASWLVTSGRVLGFLSRVAAGTLEAAPPDCSVFL